MKIILISSYIIAICFAFVSEFSAQTPPTKLVLNTPIESLVTNDKAMEFTINLSTNQTAVVEVEPKGIVLFISAYNPSGNLYLNVINPLSTDKKKLILVTSTNAGEYRVSVNNASLLKKQGKFGIELTEIRKTISEDNSINQVENNLATLTNEIREILKSGTAVERRGGIEKARELLKLAKMKKDRVWEAEAWAKIGLLHLGFGQLQEALNAYSKTLEIGQELENPYYIKLSLTSIASIWINAGDYEKAISYSTQAIGFARKSNDFPLVILNLSNMSFAYLFLKQPEKTIQIIEKAILPTAVMAKILSLESTMRVVLGSAYIEMGEIEKGIASMQKGVDLGKQINSTESLSLLLSLSKALLENGKGESSFESLTEAAKLSEKIGDRQRLVEIYYYLARIEQERNNLVKAFEQVEKGLAIAENLRTNITNKNLRTSYFSTVQDSYELYTDLLVERGVKNKRSADITRALEISERSRSRSLVDLLQEANVGLKKGVDRDLLQRQKDQVAELDKAYLARQELLKNDTPDQKLVDAVTSQINNLQLGLEKLDGQIQKENPRYANLTNVKSISAKEIQDLLDDKSVLVEYKLGEKRSFVWLVTKDSIDVFELPNREIIEEKAKSFYDLVVANKREDQAKVEELSKDLGETLIAPFVNKIKDKRLVIVADGILQYSPFSALQIPKTTSVLAETNEIIILPSASVLKQLRENKQSTIQNDKTIAIFADPVFDKEDSRIAANVENKSKVESIEMNGVLRDFKFGGNLSRLLASRQEANRISKFVDKNKANVQMGFDASVENVENSDLSKYQIIHFATHGFLNTSRPELSGLMFSLFDKNGQPQEGFLSLNDIYNLDLSSDMVVLSACQTALGKDVRGEGLIGISRGFLYAGSKRIVASLWKVDDSATAEFMELFYKNHLQKQMSASKALQQAKIEMKKIKRYQSPYYWSAFTLLGDWK